MNGQRVALIPFNMIKWLLQVKSEVNSGLINESSKSKRGICFWSWGGAHRLFWVLRRGKCHQKGALCHENTQSWPNNLLGVRALRKELIGVKQTLAVLPGTTTNLYKNRTGTETIPGLVESVPETLIFSGVSDTSDGAVTRLQLSPKKANCKNY